MVHRRAWALLFFSGALGLLLAASGGAWEVTVESLSVPGLDSDDPGFVSVGAIAADPRGGLLAVDSKTFSLLHLPLPGGSPLSVSELLGGELPKRPLQLASSADAVAIYDYDRRAVLVYRETGERLRALPALAFNGYQGLALVERTLFGIGVPIVSEKPVSKENLEDAAWRARNRRGDCRLFKVDLKKDSFLIDPLVCNEGFTDGSANVLPSGAVAASRDGERIFAVLHRSASLHVFDRSGRPLTEVSYLEPGEDPGWPSPAELSAIGPEDLWRMIGQLDYASGLVRGEGVVGILFRRRAGGAVRFVIDLFTNRGTKIADDLPVPLPPAGATALARTIDGGGHGELVLLQELAGLGEITHQKLYRLELHETADEP